MSQPGHGKELFLTAYRHPIAASKRTVRRTNAAENKESQPQEASLTFSPWFIARDRESSEMFAAHDRDRQRRTLARTMGAPLPRRRDSRFEHFRTRRRRLVRRSG
jgi:hypothetical protein